MKNLQIFFVYGIVFVHELEGYRPCSNTYLFGRRLTMLVIPSLPDPFDWPNLYFREFEERWEALCRNWISSLGRISGVKPADSPQDIALARINEIQVLLYRGYVQRKKLERLYSREKELQRFLHWMTRHSSNFRKLLNMYPEWLGEFDDPRPRHRTRLLRTIAFHLYQ